MTELQQNRYDQLVRRVGNIVSPGSIVGDALNELFPMIDVETLNAELELLSKWRLGFGNAVQFQLAANNSKAQLFNPAGSNNIAVLERVDLFTSTAQRIHYEVTDVALTTVVGNITLRDTREGITAPAIAEVRRVQEVASIVAFGVITLTAGVTLTMEEKRGMFVLAPGTGVTFSTTVVNTAFNASFQWRERVAEPAELSFP